MKPICRVIHTDSPIGRLLIAESDSAVIAVRFGLPGMKDLKADRFFGNYTLDSKTSAVLEKTKEELDEYFAGERRTFTVPYRLEGTRFQKAAWEAVARIPYGEVQTYSEIGRAAGSPRGARPAGQAVGANRLPLLVPCHRVVASGCTLGGFGGGLDKKKFLLDLERQHCGRAEMTG